MNHPKVVRDGKVAVLFSPGYGAGWYSWNYQYPACLFDPDIVFVVLASPDGQPDADAIDKLAKAKWGEDFYAGGADTLSVRWLPEGTLFRVNEYDGAESIVTQEGEQWLQT